MACAKYNLKEFATCADYGKLTVEGNFEIIDETVFNQKLNELLSDLSNINSGQIIIGKCPDFDIYIYDNERFVISKITEKNKAIDFLEKLVN